MPSTSYYAKTFGLTWLSEMSQSNESLKMKKPAPASVDLFEMSKLWSLLGDWLPVEPEQSLSCLIELMERSMGVS